MWAKILLMAGPIVELVNNIFRIFKKSPQEEREKILEKNKEAKSDFETNGRPK